MLNSFSGIGRLGGEPQVHQSSNSPFTTFNIAINEFYKQNGDLKKQTHWIPCVTYGRLAEIAGEFLRKGSNVGVRGSLKMRQWGGEDGRKKQELQVCVAELVFLSARPGDDVERVTGDMNE